MPLVSCYRLDWIARQFSWIITTWSASLPNLIADRPVVPEFYNLIRPEHHARDIEALLSDSPMRRWQLEGFDEVRRRMSTDRPSGQIAAEVVMRQMAEKRIASSE